MLLVFAFVIGAQLWNYGTHYSLYKTHATYLNPWNWMVVGTLLLCVGHTMPAAIYPLTANGGEVLFLLCVMRMFTEVEGEIETQDDFLTSVIHEQGSQRSHAPMQPQAQQHAQHTRAHTYQQHQHQHQQRAAPAGTARSDGIR